MKALFAFVIFLQSSFFYIKNLGLVMSAYLFDIGKKKDGRLFEFSIWFELP